MRSTYAFVAGALAAILLVPAGASAKPKVTSQYADIRVVTNDDQTLTDIRQYSDDVKVKTSVQADCFGPSNPSSGKSYDLKKPNVLGTLIDAAKNDNSLRPLSITDGFVDDGFGFGVCDIGNLETQGFSYWYNAVNGAGATTGPDLIKTKDGDRHLWYLTTGDESGFPSELSLKAPYEVEPDEPFEVTVTRLLPDGTKEPAVGVEVSNGDSPTDSQGKTMVTVQSGFTDLYATSLQADDVNSDNESTCASDGGFKCPKAAGITIFGSPGSDRIRSPKGDDEISCGKGKDVVIRDKSNRRDDIADDCEKVIKR